MDDKVISIWFPVVMLQSIKAEARRRNISISAVVRESLSETLGYPDTIRCYYKDGNHTQDKIAEKSINAILRKMKR